MPAARSTRQSLAEAAYESIRKRILSGYYPLGAPLSRRKLAEELGMSLVPVAEALNRLEGEELVESQPRAGTRVRIPNSAEIRGHYLVREALESQAARLFAQLAGATEKRELTALATSLDKQASQIRKVAKGREALLADYERDHIRFHLRIAELCGSPQLVQAIEHSRVLVFNWLLQISVTFDPLPDRWHRDLAANLSQGDPLAADAAIRVHVNRRREDYIQEFERRFPQAHREEHYVRGPRRSRAS